MAPRNTWLLHPWLPIDVRLPALVGCVSAGTYLWLEKEGKLDEAKQRLQEAQRASEGAITTVSSSLKSFKLPSWMQVGSSTSKSSSQPSTSAEEPGAPLNSLATVLPSILCCQSDEQLSSKLTTCRHSTAER